MLPFIILIVAVIVFICIVANRLSTRIGVPTLLLFIVLGMAFGSDGLVKIPFDNYALAEPVCSIALLFIIFYGGFGTRWSAAKPVAVKSILLSSLGVVITALLTAVFCRFVLGMELLEGMLLGAVLSSTDAASVFFILRSKKLNLKNGSASMLELESGSNDPFAYMLTIAVLTAMDQPTGAGPMLKLLCSQICIGLFAGYVIGWLSAKMLKRGKAWGQGFDTIFVFAAALLSYALPATLGGNGYLSAYLAGSILGNQKLDNQKNLVSFFDAFTGLMQMVLFFLLGLLAFPSLMGPTLIPAFLVALFLTFIARPAAVGLLLAPFKIKTGQFAVVSWGGLRGAASIVFAIMAVNHNSTLNYDIFHIVFGVVLFSILIQGSLLPAVARMSKMIDENSDVMRTFSDYTENKNVQFVQISIDATHPWLNQKIAEIELLPDTLIALVMRGDETIVPKGQTFLLQGDTAIVCAKGLLAVPDILLSEIAITSDHQWCNKKISEAHIAKSTIIVMIKRNGQVLIPDGSTQLLENDTVIFYSRSANIVHS